MWVPTLFRSYADGVMALGKASIRTNPSKPQCLVGGCLAKIGADFDGHTRFPLWLSFGNLERSTVRFREHSSEQDIQKFFDVARSALSRMREYCGRLSERPTAVRVDLAFNRTESMEVPSVRPLIRSMAF
jgi:hypothetical protein